MDVVMERLFVHYQKEYHLGQQVKSAMIYPMVLLAMCIGVVLLIVAFILPQFEELFSEMESLPAPTEFLMAASDFLIQKWFLLLCIVPAAGVFFALAGKIRQVRRLFKTASAGGWKTEPCYLHGAFFQDTEQSVFQRNDDCRISADSRGDSRKLLY